MIDNIVKILNALAQLIGSFAWPAVALIFLWWFGTTLRNFIGGLSEGSFKGFGFEASARKAVVAEALVTAETKSLTESEAVEIRLAPGTGKSWRLADFVASSARFEQLKGRSILWVDDQPKNNMSEQLALTSLGLNVTTATTTQQALSHLKSQAFDVIISDMQREEGTEAGYDLLGKIRDANIDVPVIFYRSSHSASLETEALNKGAFGSTNEAVDLIILIANALRGTGKLDLGREYGRRLRELRNFLVHHPSASYRGS